MTPRRFFIEVALAVALLAIAFVSGLTYGGRLEAGKAAKAQAQSDQHEGAALDHAAQASSLTKQGAAAGVSEAKAEAIVATAKRDLDAIRARLHTVPLTSATVGNLPEIPDSSIPKDAQLIIAKQDAVMVAQDGQIAALKLQVSIAKAEAAQWHAAYNESQKALALEQVSKAAAVRSESRRGWLHTLEGAALGALAGRLSR